VNGQFLHEAARPSREELLEEADGVRLARELRGAERSPHRFFAWIGGAWAVRVGQWSHAGAVKGACCV
jgi:hypothetical protein